MPLNFIQKIIHLQACDWVNALDEVITGVRFSPVAWLRPDETSSKTDSLVRWTLFAFSWLIHGT
jgi:hypothetical protein